MKALVFQGPGQTSWQDVPGRGIKDADDAVIRVDAVTGCGTDLHIVKGDVPEVSPGTVLAMRPWVTGAAMPRSCFSIGRQPAGPVTYGPVAVLVR